jgi:hypothetical protein
MQLAERWNRCAVTSLGEERLRYVDDSWNSAHRPCRTATSNKLHGRDSPFGSLGILVLHSACWCDLVLFDQMLVMKK